MRVSLNWLKTLVKIELPVDEIAEILTIAGIEVEEIIEVEDDTVFEIAILANIARCLSMVGVAKEIAALTESEYIGELNLASVDGVAETLTPEISNPEVCSRFSMALFENVQVQDSPEWMQKHLRAVGVTPINNVVDASNYVMFEIGHPTHAYDAERLQHNDLNVRLSKKGEQLHTLVQSDEQDALALQPGFPVIACGEEVVAVAGIVGGTPTSVCIDTHNILLESACFDYIAIRRSQAAHKTLTDGSARFSRGVDPATTITAIRRFLQLLKETSPDVKMVAIGDNIAQEITSKQIVISSAEVNQSLGINLNVAQIADLLRRVEIECEIDQPTQQLTATITSARNDLSMPCDLLEEVARLYGFDKLPATMPEQPIPIHPRNMHYEQREHVRDAIVRAGLQEVMSYSLTHPEHEAKLYVTEKKPPKGEYVAMMNTLSEERSVLRRSLLPHLFDHVRLNLRYTDHCHLFEIGRVFLGEGQSHHKSLPAEPERVAAVMTGPFMSASLHNKAPRNLDFFDMKGTLESLFRQLHLPKCEFIAEEIAPYQAGQCARVICGEIELGSMGAVHELVLDAFNIQKHRVYAFDLDLQALLNCARLDFAVYAPLRFPSVDLDISVVVEEKITAGQLRTAVWQHGGDFLQTVSVFDVYRSVEHLGEAKKAVAIRFDINAMSRTLTMEEATEVRDKIVAGLSSDLGAELRQ